MGEDDWHQRLNQPTELVETKLGVLLGLKLIAWSNVRDHKVYITWENMCANVYFEKSRK